DAGLQVFGVHELEHHLGPERLGGIACLTLQLHVAGRDEVDPPQDAEPRALRKCRRPPCRQHALEPGRRRNPGHRRTLEKTSTAHTALATLAHFTLRCLHRRLPAPRPRRPVTHQEYPATIATPLPTACQPARRPTFPQFTPPVIPDAPSAG